MQPLMLSSIGWYWLVLPLAAAFFGLIVLVRGFGHFFSGKAGRGSAHLLAGTPIALLGVTLSLLGFNAQTFSRLTFEAPVAEVTVKAVDPANSLYAVTVKRQDASVPAQTCQLQGDAWELSARVQKWKPWANVFGLDATYQLDQITNRYFSAARASGHYINSCDLKGPAPAVNAIVPQSVLFWVLDQAYVEDRQFGSAAYMPLADGAAYQVIMTQSGLNAQPDNDAARAAYAGHRL